MANFIPPQNDYMSPFYGSLGNLLGAGLGGFGNYIAQEYRAPEMEKSFQSWGATPDQAKFLARQPPQQQQQWINQQQKMLAAQQRNKSIADIYAGKMPGGQQIQTQPNENISGNVMGQPTENVPSAPMSKEDKRLDADMRKATRDMDHEGKNRLLQSGILNPQEADALRRQMEMERGNDIREEKFAHEKEEASEKHREQAFKITAPLRAELAKEEESAGHMRDVIKEQFSLSKSGKMTHHGFLEFLEKLGADFNFLKSSETEIYQSLEKEYLKDIKSVFGGKVSNEEMKAFLRGVAKATNSPEAREGILKKWDAFFKSKQLRSKVARQITKENGGIPPLDLQERILEKVQQKEKQYVNQFRGIPKDAVLGRDKQTGQRVYRTPDGKIVPIEEEV